MADNKWKATMITRDAETLINRISHSGVQPDHTTVIARLLSRLSSVVADLAPQPDEEVQPAMAHSENPTIKALQNHLREVDAARHDAIVAGETNEALIRDIEMDEIKRCIAIVRKASSNGLPRR